MRVMPSNVSSAPYPLPVTQCRRFPQCQCADRGGFLERRLMPAIIRQSRPKLLAPLTLIAYSRRHTVVSRRTSPVDTVLAQRKEECRRGYPGLGGAYTRDGLPSLPPPQGSQIFPFTLTTPLCAVHSPGLLPHHPTIPSPLAPLQQSPSAGPGEGPLDPPMQGRTDEVDLPRSMHTLLERGPGWVWQSSQAVKVPPSHTCAMDKHLPSVWALVSSTGVHQIPASTYTSEVGYSLPTPIHSDRTG